MEGVLPRTPSDRPRADAVGALAALCLVGAPLMSLLPSGVWAAYRSLPVDSATVGVLLMAPVAVGAVLAMFGLASHLLRAAGVNHHLSCAGLVTGVSSAVPVLTAVLTPFPYERLTFTAALSAFICALALGACAVPHPFPRRWRYPGTAPAMVVAALLLLYLPAASERALSNAAHEHAQQEIERFEGSIALLDHHEWEPARAHRVHRGLRLAYEGPAGSPVHVLSWTESDMHRDCDFPDVHCEDTAERSSERAEGQMLVVRRPGGGTVEVRTRMANGMVVSVLADRADVEAGSVDPVDEAGRVRVEGPGEREALTEQLTG